MEPEFFEETETEEERIAPGRKLYCLGARGFVLEMCWLAPQVYNMEVGGTLIVVPAYRNEFMERYLGSADDPGEKFEKAISIELTRRMPASVRESNKPFDSGKEVIPRVRQEVRNADGGFTTILGQKFDNYVKFSCWARTNTEADLLIEWLEAFLVRWQFWFEGMGIDKMFYSSAGSDLSPEEAAAMSTWRQPFKVRTLEWYIRDEKLFYIDMSEIEQIRLRVLTEGNTRRLEYVI